MTTEVIGRRCKILVGRETTEGTLSTLLKGFPDLSYSVAETKNTLENTQGYGSISGQAVKSKIGSRMSTVTISGICSGALFPDLMRAVYSQIDTDVDTPVAGAYTHTFELLETNNPTPFSIVHWDGIEKRQVLGAVLQSLTINIQAGEWTTWEATFLGKFPEDSSVVDGSFVYDDAGAHFTAAEAQLKLADAFSGFGAASAIPVINGSIVFTKNATQDHNWGSVDIVKSYNGKFDVTGNIELRWTGSQIDLFRDHTPKAMQISLTSDEYVTGTTPFSWVTQLDTITFRTGDIDRALDNMTPLAMDFTREDKQDVTDKINSVVVNGTAGTEY